VYGIGGELIAEYDDVSGELKKEYIYGASRLVATIEPVTGTRYVTADTLGTPRVVTTNVGEVVSRHDYQPFGEELFEGMGGRTQAQGYSNEADTLRQKFTGKERDNETGLDYFLARYYSSMLGRFTSPDEFTGGPDELFNFADDASDNPTFYADLTNPQALNKYQYCLNNPLRYIDPDGHQQQDETWYDKLMQFLGQLWKSTGRGQGMEYGANSEESSRKRESAGPLDMDYGTVARGSWETVGKGLDTYGEVLATLDPTGIASGAKGVLEGDSGRVITALAGSVIHIGGTSLTMREAKSLVGGWAKDPVKNKISVSILYHYKEHGAEVGAKSVVQYLRKAQAFARNLKGVKPTPVAGKTPGVMRYRKAGKYIDLNSKGKIVSFGKIR
jgi:RHS repeat-associated protein